MMDRVLKDKILAHPDVILDDADVMRALISANDLARGPNVIDLRGLAMQRLEERLDRLEDTHKSVIAAAYDNLAGTNQIHRAVLRMMDAESFDAFLSILNDDVAQILRVDTIRIIFETRAIDAAQAQALSNLHPMIGVEGPGFVQSYMTQGHGTLSSNVVVRPAPRGASQVYGEQAAPILSEAALHLSLGGTCQYGMAAFGSVDAKQFSPQQATDLLSFFAGVLERVLRRWLV
jgi:uncharacterized protein YigA (DUF484 family)